MSSANLPSLTILPDGTLTFLWSDELEPIMTLGRGKVERASHVEHDGGGWLADLSPVGGPTLGPFRLRADALAAEVEWLEANHFGRDAE